MSSKAPETAVKKKEPRFAFPHTMLIIVAIGIIVTLLTYVIPAGTYDYDANGMMIADSFHYIEQTPVNYWDLMLSITDSFMDYGIVTAILLIIGASLRIVISVGAIDNVIGFSLYKLQDKGVKVLIPCIVVLMGLLGAVAGNDGLIVFVTAGVLLAKRLRLDRIAAMSIFYLPYITGQATGPTTLMILMAQEMAGVQPVSGIAARIVIWILFMTVCATYTTRYCLKIAADPSKSIMGVEEPDESMGDEFQQKTLHPRSVTGVVLIFVPFLLYAFGARAWGWSIHYMTTLVLISAVVTAVIHRLPFNETCDRMLEGAASMGGVIFIIGIGSMIATALEWGNIVHTIAYHATNVIGSFGTVTSGVLMFLFTLFLNLVEPGGIPKLQMLMPLYLPMGEVLGLSKQVVCLIYQLGDGLTNYLTPMSTVLLSGLMLADVKINKWLKYALPYAGILVVIATVAIAILQMIGWQ